LVVGVFKEAKVKDIRSILIKTIGYRYTRGEIDLDQVIRRAAKGLIRKDVLNEIRDKKHIKYELTDEGRAFLHKLDSYRNLMMELSRVFKQKEIKECLKSN